MLRAPQGGAMWDLREQEIRAHAKRGGRVVAKRTAAAGRKGEKRRRQDATQPPVAAGSTPVDPCWVNFE